MYTAHAGGSSYQIYGLRRLRRMVRRLRRDAHGARRRRFLPYSLFPIPYSLLAQIAPDESQIATGCARLAPPPAFALSIPVSIESTSIQAASRDELVSSDLQSAEGEATVGMALKVKQL